MCFVDGVPWQVDAATGEHWAITDTDQVMGEVEAPERVTAQATGGLDAAESETGVLALARELVTAEACWSPFVLNIPLMNPTRNRGPANPLLTCNPGLCPQKCKKNHSHSGRDQSAHPLWVMLHSEPSSREIRLLNLSVPTTTPYLRHQRTPVVVFPVKMETILHLHPPEDAGP